VHGPERSFSVHVHNVIVVSVSHVELNGSELGVVRQGRYPRSGTARQASPRNVENVLRAKPKGMETWVRARRLILYKGMSVR